MFKRLTIVLLLVVSGFSTAQAFANNAEEKKLLRIFDEIWQYDMTRDPTYATYVGYPGQNGLWPDVSQYTYTHTITTIITLCTVNTW